MPSEVTCKAATLKQCIPCSVRYRHKCNCAQCGLVARINSVHSASTATEGPECSSFVQTGYHDLITASDQDGEQYLVRGEIKGAKPLFEAPPRERPAQFVHKEASRARPWDDWDEWDFRLVLVSVSVFALYTTLMMSGHRYWSGGQRETPGQKVHVAECVDCRLFSSRTHQIHSGYYFRCRESINKLDLSMLVARGAVPREQCSAAAQKIAWKSSKQGEGGGGGSDGIHIMSF